MAEGPRATGSRPRRPRPGSPARKEGFGRPAIWPIGNQQEAPASYEHSRPRAGEEAGMRRFLAGFAAVAAALIATTQPAAACAGLIGPNGAVNLLRTTTFAGYHNGVEHYI